MDFLLCLVVEVPSRIGKPVGMQECGGNRALVREENGGGARIDVNRALGRGENSGEVTNRC